jgi:RNA polymerase sigma-70 factor (ECF subfamily)
MNTAIAGRKRPRKVNQPSDEHLLLEYRKTGDRDLFARLVKRYEQELFSYLHRYTSNAEMAEDAFQTTFLQVHLKCNQFEDGRRFRPWLYAIATNQAIDAQRRNKRHRASSLDQMSSQEDNPGTLLETLASSEPDPTDTFDVKQGQMWVRREIAALPDHLRSVVALVYFQGLKYREAAIALGVPVGTVKSRLHAAIARLNEAWRMTQVQRN